MAGVGDLMPKTYWPKTTALATGLHAGTFELEMNTTPSTGGGTAQSASISASSNIVSHVFTTPSGEPNSADWPSGTYRMQLDCSAVGANVTYNLNSTSSHFSRVSDALSAHRESFWQSEANFSGTGLKLATSVVDPAAGAASDRFECAVQAVNANTMSAQSLALDVASADAWVDGPWEDVVFTARPPFGNANRTAVRVAAMR